MIPQYTKKKKELKDKQNILNIITGTEVETGRIIDGKKEYMKRINCGNMPDTNTIKINTGLSNVVYQDFKGIVVDPSSDYSYKMDTKKINDYSILLQLLGNQINITTYRSSYATCTGYVEVYYLKK